MNKPQVLTVGGQHSEAISRAIASIYRYSQSPSIDVFKQKVLDKLNQLNTFDAACWLSFSGDEVPDAAPSAFLYRLEEDFWAFFKQFLSEVKPSQTTSPGTSTNSVQLVLSSEDANRHLHKFNLHQQLIVAGEFQSTRHLICLYRHSPSDPFTEQQVSLNLFMTDNVTKAFEAYLRYKLDINWDYNQSFKAICDQKGHIVAMGNGFYDCLASNLPNWHQTKLVDIFADEMLPEKLNCGPFMMQISQDKDLYLLELYLFDPLIEKLTPSEINVAKWFAKGLSVKEVAAVKGLAYRTIDNQLSSIHQKLNISKNTDLVNYLLNSNYNFAC
ncbi:MAG: helix-turn-helix transcriptional regulator [Psychrosphaera sp.]|nr:helix-turn-helix transcriptional regulator [Psychrosphaera sp.]